MIGRMKIDSSQYWCFSWSKDEIERS